MREIISCFNQKMVKTEQYQGRRIFVCESCQFGYAERILAEKCEHYCGANRSCSLEITKHALKRG
ncbi:hypothetical protein HY496_03210 [Candidatus Woesearchaeota archaeon]|nr:hypothetical protein [Candidatus Woesearchaeota archaeon]